MKKIVVISFLLVVIITSFSFNTENLRKVYSRDPSQWPKPDIAPGVVWKELGVIPESPLQYANDSIKNVIELGKVLFFDTRLSESGKISCATCHQPELSWTDGKEVSVGHEGAKSKRNSPTIQNVWFYNKLFWDGRANNLQDQAFAPINSETEMHSDMPDVMRKLRAVKGYAPLFKKAFGSEQITPDNFTEAIAVFERTIVSSKSRFDEFLLGNKKALNKEELKGLHIFRTKAGCMNCHNGPLFSDNGFHKTSLSVSGTQTDKGLYNITHLDADIGKFKTPSLRDVMRTGPWTHNGSMNDMMQIMLMYKKSNPLPSGETRSLDLSESETKALIAFLEAITAPPVKFVKPVAVD